MSEPMFQPDTTDNTPMGRMKARNAMREYLWADSSRAHSFVCHNGEACPDGCGGENVSLARLALYATDIETNPHAVKA